MYCFVVVFFLQFKQLQRVVTMALKSFTLYAKFKNWTLFSVASMLNHSYKNSIVFRLARHLCSSTSLVVIVAIIGERDTYRGNTIENRGCLFICIYVWTYVCHFVLWPSRFCVSYVVDPVPNCTKQNPLVYLSVPDHPRNWIVYRFEFFCGCS